MFLVSIDQKKGQLYETNETYVTAHKDICMCLKIFPYPREALRVTYMEEEYSVDLEGYILSMTITGQIEIINDKLMRKVGYLPDVVFIEGFFFSNLDKKLASPGWKHVIAPTTSSETWNWREC